MLWKLTNLRYFIRFLQARIASTPFAIRYLIRRTCTLHKRRGFLPTAG